MQYGLILVCIGLVLVFLYTEKNKQYISATILKGLASVCFVLLGLLCSPGTGTARMIVYGLITGAVADVLLNLRWVFPAKGQRIFLVGIVVFLVGHILYLAAVLPLSDRPVIGLGVSLVLTVLLLKWIFRQITAKPAFKIFGVIYIGAITLLNSVAFDNLLVNPSAFNGIFAVGALLFLVSDVVLILNTFGSEFKQSLRITNISLYYMGQLLIALSLLQLAA